MTCPKCHDFNLYKNVIADDDDDEDTDGDGLVDDVDPDDDNDGIPDEGKDDMA